MGAAVRQNVGKHSLGNRWVTPLQRRIQMENEPSRARRHPLGSFLKRGRLSRFFSVRSRCPRGLGVGHGWAENRQPGDRHQPQGRGSSQIDVLMRVLRSSLMMWRHREDTPYGILPLHCSESVRRPCELPQWDGPDDNLSVHGSTLLFTRPQPASSHTHLQLQLLLLLRVFKRWSDKTGRPPASPPQPRLVSGFPLLSANLEPLAESLCCEKQAIAVLGLTPATMADETPAFDITQFPSFPPEVQRLILEGSAATVPPGITPNFIDPPNNNILAIVILSVCFFIATICALGRAWTRLVIAKQFGLEDFLGLLCYGCYVVLGWVNIEFLIKPGFYVHQYNVQFQDMVEISQVSPSRPHLNVD